MRALFTWPKASMSDHRTAISVAYAGTVLPSVPHLTIRARATSHSPDLFDRRPRGMLPGDRNLLATRPPLSEG